MTDPLDSSQPAAIAAQSRPSSTLKRIAVSRLRLGMHLHSFEGSWVDHPFWRSKFLLDDPVDLELAAAMRRIAGSMNRWACPRQTHPWIRPLSSSPPAYQRTKFRP